MRKLRKLPKISLFEPKKKSIKRVAISKRSRRRRINYSQIDLATDSEKKLQYVLKMCQNGQNCYFMNQKRSETKGQRVPKSISSRSNFLQKHEGKE